LDEAMGEHMAHIVLSLNRPFSYQDFMQFHVDGEVYEMRHGTFRNKICSLKKKGEIELDCSSGIAFYTLKGYRFGKAVTLGHTGASDCNNNLSDYLMTLPLGMRTVHNIRLLFRVHGLWLLLASDPAMIISPGSKDIRLRAMKLDALVIGVVVHRTDTVTVEVSCSLEPIPLSVEGILVLSNALTRVEERLSVIIKNAQALLSNSPDLHVQDNRSWQVTMWHFGRDSSTECGGREFHMTWGTAENTLIRAYTKDMGDGRRRVRLEKQEYPKKRFLEAIEDKLNS
jgi:hypothetical protein